jgi:cell division protease FtsH
MLDPALLRGGRFDRQVLVDRPDKSGRIAILNVHLKKAVLAADVDAEKIAELTPGFTGADLANLVNEAALNAARQNRKVVMMLDFELAKDKILMGAERKSMILSDAEKRNTAYHEAGHALVAAVLPNADPLHKVTIIPRGMALGVTMQLPIDDKHSYNRDYLLSQLAILMGGRIAEEKFMHHMTTGAGNDIERATDLARKMVCEWGMSELGPLSFGKKEEQIFLGREIAQHRDYSEETAIRIDEQVKKLVQGGYDTALNILQERSEALVKIAETLLEREILDGNEVMQIINGQPLAPLASAGPKDSEDHTQQVLRPEGGRRLPGLSEGERPQPA